MENDKNAKNYAGLNIGGVVGDYGKVTINKLAVCRRGQQFERNGSTNRLKVIEQARLKQAIAKSG